MTSHISHRLQRAFTLVELLVVIGIIAVLISILLPALSRAREAAKALQCSSNMRQIGQAILLFANEHKGRGPSGGQLKATSNPAWTSSFSWIEQLNNEAFMARNYIPRMVITSSSKLYCPSFMLNDSGSALFQSNRTYVANPNLVKGPPAAGKAASPTDGVSIDPASVDWTLYIQGSLAGAYIKAYNLGPQLSRFKNQAEKYMIIESEDGRDALNVAWNNTPVQWCTQYPWCAGNTVNTDGSRRAFAFRHNKLCNILFFDGHVASVGFDPGMAHNKYLTAD